LDCVMTSQSIVLSKPVLIVVRLWRPLIEVVVEISTAFIADADGTSVAARTVVAIRPGWLVFPSYSRLRTHDF